MDDSRPKARVFVDTALAPQTMVTLDKDQSHYVVKVMRSQAGDLLALFNGKDGEFWAELVVADKKHAQLQLRDRQRDQLAEPDIWLCFAPVKYGKIDFMAQKATELGASRLMPIHTKRTIVERLKYERLKANVIEAAEQTERLTIPKVESLQSLPNLLQNWPSDRLLIVADETGQGQPPHDLLPVLQESKLGLLIGPEGGFAPEEHRQFAALPNLKRLSLGPRILRADTAALAALTCLQAFCGDWREGAPHFRHP
jgi:16S rRNA (uracil1498-N3)-methyltransferase